MSGAAPQRPGVPTADYAGPERATEGYASEPRRAAHTGSVMALEPGELIELDGAGFRVDDVLSRRGAEATIYRIRDAAGHALVLKLYRAFARPREEPNPEALARVAAITAPGVLRLHRFGAGPRKLRGRFCYEVCDLAAGGDLLSPPPEEMAATYTPEFVRRVVVPQLFDGLRVLQRHHIYHCDLKPQNIFWLDEARTRLTIGDYGSAKTTEEGAAVGLAHTELVKGTDFYLAPEQARRIVSAKNDYYSFGMVLVHLLRPDLVSHDGLGRILRRQLDRRPPLDDDDGRLGDLARLIGGLTLYDPEARWGEAEVARWLAGEEVEVRYRSDLDPIKVDAHTVLRSVPELIAFLEREPRAAAILVDDEVGLRDLKTWVARLEGLEAQRRFAGMTALLRGRSHVGGGAAREVVLRWFDPARPVRVREVDFDVAAASDPVVEAVRALRYLDRAVRAAPESASASAATSLVGLEGVLRRIADGALESRSRGRARAQAQAICTRIDAVLGALPGEHGEAEPNPDGNQPWDGVPRWFLRSGPEELLALFYAADPERGFRGDRGERAETLEELGLHLAAHPDALGSPATAREVRHFLAQKDRVDLTGLPRRELLFALLQRQQRFEVRATSLTVEARHYRLECEVGRSLAELLRASGLRGSGLEPITTREEHLIDRKSVPWWRRLRRRAAAGRLASATLDSVRVRHGLAPEAFDSRCRDELRRDLERVLRSDERSTHSGRLIVGARVAVVALPLALITVLALAAGGVIGRRDRGEPAQPPATTSPSGAPRAVDTNAPLPSMPREPAPRPSKRVRVARPAASPPTAPRKDTRR